MDLLVTRIEERSYSTIARNRFIGEHDLATLSKYLTMQANLACDLALAGNPRAAIMAEAAAHWAFCLQPDLRAEDDTFWADTYPLTGQN